MNEYVAELRQMIQNILPAPVHAEIGLSVPLGGAGLGIDSVGIVMLLLECEAKWGISFPAELLERPPLTIEKLVDHLQMQQSS